MLRVRVVGRREEPVQTPVQQTAPGMPQVMQWGTSVALLVVPVDENGETIASQGSAMAMGGGGAQAVMLAAGSLDDIAEYVTGETYQLVP